MSPIIVGGRTLFGSLSSQPTGITTTAGSQYYDTTDDKMKVYNGTAWADVGGVINFLGTNATHWWKSEGIVSNTAWNAERGSINFGAGGSGTLTYNASDSNFNGHRTISQAADQSRFLQAGGSGTNGTFWDSTSAFSVIVAFRKTAHIGGTWGDCLFVQQRNGQPDAGWAIDIEGDHTWNGSYGETFGNYGSFSFPQKGIMCVRCGANGASSQVLWWPSGASSWTQLATGTNYPSSISNFYDGICLFNFDGATHNGHRFEGAIAEVGYFKNLRIDDTTRDAWKDYLVTKFGF